MTNSLKDITYNSMIIFVLPFLLPFFIAAFTGIISNIDDFIPNKEKKNLLPIDEAKYENPTGITSIQIMYRYNHLFFLTHSAWGITTIVKNNSIPIELNNAFILFYFLLFVWSITLFLLLNKHFAGVKTVILTFIVVVILRILLFVVANS